MQSPISPCSANTPTETPGRGWKPNCSSLQLISSKCSNIYFAASGVEPLPEPKTTKQHKWKVSIFGTEAQTWDCQRHIFCPNTIEITLKYSKPCTRWYDPSGVFIRLPKLEVNFLKTQVFCLGRVLDRDRKQPRVTNQLHPPLSL